MNLPEPDFQPELPPRRVVAAEDGLVLLCLALLWLPIAGYHGPWVTAVLVADLLAMVVLLRRRKQRLDKLLEDYRQHQEALRQRGAVPGLPFIPPERLRGSEPPPVQVGRNGSAPR
ncbi:MAG: hypothetical protein IT204_02135 [Fimbriimonadaceae bacterium]|nr:hypothetical protein [Fimbriimonadaceae bacterium]